MTRQRSLETIGILSSGIAHDFNNLLVTIIGNADLALRKLDSDSPAYHHIRHIKTASVRASSLTGQLLAYTGNGTVSREPIDLNVVVEEMASLFSAAMPSRISMTFRFAAESPVVLANETQIRQVVMNLITNAIDAIGDCDGEIVLRTGVTGSVDGMQFESGNEPGYAVLEVTDTGCGIPDGVCERMFEPFFTTKPSGRGLGLAIVGEHVSGNNGQVRASNRTDGCNGASFTVWLPLSGCPVDECDSEVADIQDTTPMTGTVLVIDDEAEVRDTTGAMLEDAGFTVMTAATGQEGITLFDQDPSLVDLVLVDMTLPTRDGYDVAGEIKRKRPDIPIIMTSGYGDVNAGNRKNGNVIEVFLRKPYHMGELLETVGGVLRAGQVRND